MSLVFRKLYRLSGLVFPLIYFFSDRRTTLLWLSLITFLFFVLETVRFIFPQFNRQFCKTFTVILKAESEQKILGTTYFLIGSLLSVIFFTQPIAVTALLFLVIGDAASALIGVKWGRIKLGKKTLEGSLAFFISCLLMGVILKSTYLRLDLGVYFWGALAATLAELLPIPIDDNLTIPLGAGLVMAVIL